MTRRSRRYRPGRPGVMALAATLACGFVWVAGSAATAPTIGTLTQQPDPSGCIADSGKPVTGCATATALLGPAPFFGSHSVVVSPDGRNVYAVSFGSSAVVVFDRDPSTGSLTQKSGTAGCISAAPKTGCARGRALSRPTSVDISPDGHSVYVASLLGQAVAVFDRRPSDGVLRQKAGRTGCIANSGRAGCATGRALEGPFAVAVSPTGNSVYVNDFRGDAVAVFDRSTTGALRQKPGPAGCIVNGPAMFRATNTPTEGCTTGVGLDGPEGSAVSPDGKSFYVGSAIGGTLAVFDRRPDGTLVQKAGRAGCFGGRKAVECTQAAGLVGADSIAISRNGRSVYVVSGIGNSLALFDRDRSGRLSQLVGVGGCFTNMKKSRSCTPARQLGRPEGVVVSRDGSSVYVGSYKSSAIAVFDRDHYTGTLVQRAGANGCIVDVATSGCVTGKALANANGLAISPDGHSVYVGAFGSNAVDVFDRVASSR